LLDVSICLRLSLLLKVTYLHFPAHMWPLVTIQTKKRAQKFIRVIIIVVAAVQTATSRRTR